MSENNNQTETVTDISAEIRRRWEEASEAYDYGIIEPSEIIGWSERLDAAQKRDSEIIEGIKREIGEKADFCHNNTNSKTWEDWEGMYKWLLGLRERIEGVHHRESVSIERIVRDAIIGYEEMFQTAPNDNAEAELKQRAATANVWLVSHGFKPEEVKWSKEEVSPF